MSPLRLTLGASLVLALASVAAAPLAAAQTAPPPTEAAPSAPDVAVEPAALETLERMSNYLKTLTSFEIVARTSQDLVTADDQKVQIDGVNRYLVRRPDGFRVEVATDHRVRQLIYDGKQMTLFAPERGVYATVDAPPTAREALDLAEEKYGLAIPLQDLFAWTDLSQHTRPGPETASVIGVTRIDGVDCDHLAFREGSVDWQIWIQRGDKPLPRRIVIIDRAQTSLPRYEGQLTWNEPPQITADTFTFTPPTGAIPIRIATVEPL
ncbi:DUF2092 domain-containing protein [Brevundimonas sp. Root1423]|uniref:DUF2092 domain-containing protein n=1 Tax=Brevundimonas sp. Root1423 TaxID=1736462 RepID=UPI0006F95C1F|nr:DUF2092 domain-containing protein [Brevundimonas sp. Root1423]KQY75443.1 hypothetical protein ASD25_12985 [Brevundimonas sp. Root1423]